jgi:hypothetical protein
MTASSLLRTDVLASGRHRNGPATETQLFPYGTTPVLYICERGERMAALCKGSFIQPLHSAVPAGT